MIPRCPLCGRRLRPNQPVVWLGGVPSLTVDPSDHVLVHARCAEFAGARRGLDWVDLRGAWETEGEGDL
jgi:hypothetical protein